MTQLLTPSIDCPDPQLPASAQGIARVAVDVDDTATQLAQLIVTFEHPLPSPQFDYLLEARSYSLTGGQRLFPRIVAAKRLDPADPNDQRVRLTLTELGDFSVYTLTVSGPDIDPFFASHKLRFRLDCDDPFDCRAPAPDPLPEADLAVVIDYLAKDYSSFRQGLLDFIPTRLPAWTERSEADIGMMLLELFASTADSLSYMQDRVANEAFLSSATQRRSVAGHLALIGYTMDEGAAAYTWLQLQVNVDTQLQPGLRVSNSPRRADEPLIIFETLAEATLRTAHNQMQVYAWNNQACCLPREALSAALVGSFPKLRQGDYLLFDDGADQRNIVRLVENPQLIPAGTTSLNPAAPVTLVRWSQATPLTHDYCVGAQLIVRGNLVVATHGESVAEPYTLTPFRRQHDAQRIPRVRVRLDQAPLAHLDAVTLALGQPIGTTPATPTNTIVDEFLSRATKSISTLTVTVDSEPWQQQPTLLNSRRDDKVFRVEIDDQGDATIVFGDNTFGARPPATAKIDARYRVGGGEIGNLAADTLVVARPAGTQSLLWLDSVTNPLPARGGRDLESRDHARRFGPPTFHTPLVAVTAADYQAAAQAFTVAGQQPIQRANAAFRWTGSWLTVTLAVDPRAEEGLSAELRRQLLGFLETRRMAGYDLEVTRAVYVPIELRIALCLAPGFRAGDVLKELKQALSAADLASGRRGFFHPDNFTFGDKLYVSQLYAAIMAVPGVESAQITRLTRLRSAHPDRDTAANHRQGYLTVGINEIIQLDNDPNFPEHGNLAFQVKGGVA